MNVDFSVAYETARSLLQNIAGRHKVRKNQTLLKLRAALPRYGIGVLATALSLVLWLLLARTLGSDVPLMVFILGVMVATRYGGLGPGLLTIALSVLAVSLTAQRYHSVYLIHFPQAIRLILFLMVGLLVTWIMETLHVTRHRSRTHEERFRLLVEGVKDYALFMTDAEGRIASWNPGAERLLGFREAEILGQPFSRIFTPEDIAQNIPAAEMNEARAKGRASDERWHVRKDGTRFFATGAVHPLHDDNGKISGFAKILQDITERQRMERVLQGRAAALTSMLNALMAQPQLGDFLGGMLGVVADLLQAHSVSLWLYDKETRAASLEISFDDGKVLRKELTGCSTMPDTSLSEEVPLWEEMLRTRRAVIVEDVAGDPQIRNRKWLLARRIETLVLVPMLMDDGVVGALSLCRAGDRRWEAGEIELAQALAVQAMLALQMTRFAEQGQKAAILEERNRMAREIHDTLAQGFTGIVLQLTAAEHELTESPEKAQGHLVRARGLARESLAEARRSVWALHPRSLEHSELPDAFTRHVEQMTAGTPIQSELHVHGRPRSLSSDVESNVLRVGLEALTNAIKHARASLVSIELSFEPEQIRLSVQDNGQGFDPAATAGEGFGLTGMRERAESLEGRVTISSKPGQGTEVVLVAPTSADKPYGEIS